MTAFNFSLILQIRVLLWMQREDQNKGGLGPRVLWCSLVPRSPPLLPSVCVHNNTREDQNGGDLGLRLLWWCRTSVKGNGATLLASDSQSSPTSRKIIRNAGGWPQYTLHGIVGKLWSRTSSVLGEICFSDHFKTLNWLNVAKYWQGHRQLLRSGGGLASRIKFVAHTESQIHIFWHFSALIFGCVTLLITWKLFFSSCFSKFWTSFCSNCLYT